MQQLNDSLLNRFVERGSNTPTVVSDSQRHLFTVVNYVALCGVVSVYGVLANLVNLAVFYKQGLDSTINISFFAMAVSDLASLLLQLWYTVCVSRVLDKAALPVVFTEVLYLTGGVPREAFARITCLITVYITAERCLCIAFPLQVKQMVTPRKTAIIIISIYLLTWISGLPIYCTSRIGWRFYPDRNRTLLGVVHAYASNKMESIVFIVHAIIGVLTFLAVVVLTAILAYKLKQKSGWRKTAVTHGRTSSEVLSKRDSTTMVMVVLVAAILIACYTPAVVLCLTTFVVPGFRRGGNHFNLYYVLWSFALLFENLNAGVNIVLYWRMSSRYRETFDQLFCVSREATKTIKGQG